MKGSEPIFDSIDLLFYKLHKISLNRGGSYTDSLKWLKNKAAKIKHKNTVLMITDGEKWHYLAVKNYLLCLTK